MSSQVPGLVSILCASRRSVYYSLPQTNIYDKKRSAFRFRLRTVIVAHPPCRMWSLRLHTQAKPEDPVAERMLGLWCVDQVRQCGGVLEHPAESLLFEATGMPRPGGRDLWGETLYVEQGWFGHPQRKATWLYVVGFSGYLGQAGVLRFDRPNTYSMMSRAARSATPILFAEWLLVMARQCKAPAGTSGGLL